MPTEKTTTNDLTINTDPGRSVTFITEGHARLTLERLHNGAIKQTAASYRLTQQEPRSSHETPWANGQQVIIASPRRPSLRERASVLWDKLLNPRSFRYIGRVASSYSILNQIQYLDPNQSHPPGNEYLASAIQTLLDQDTWDRADRLSGDRHPSRPGCVTLDQYNWAAAAGQMLDDLLVSNPGAVTWLMAHCLKDPDEEIRHPGQIIQAARQHLRNNGLPDDCWRTAATLPFEVVRSLTAITGPRPDIRAIRAIAAAGNTPGPTTAYVLTCALATTDQRDYAHTTLGDHNQQRAAILACRADQGLTSLTLPQASNAMDYALAMTAGGRQVRSTTFAGFLKASERWHRQFRETNIATAWESILNQNGGRYRAWNSLVGATRFHGVTATPLITDKDLLQESIDMEHCVVTYGDVCAGGRSRIFSMSRNGQHTATCEIVLLPRGWMTAQLQGPPNSPVDQRHIKAAERLARIYQKAWKNAPGEKHHFVHMDDR